MQRLPQLLIPGPEGGANALPHVVNSSIRTQVVAQFNAAQARGERVGFEEDLHGLVGSPGAELHRLAEPCQVTGIQLTGTVKVKGRAPGGGPVAGTDAR